MKTAINRLWLLSALALGVFGTLAAVAQDAPVFDDSTTVMAVEIPVNVIKDGAPVRGLTKENFEVLDGKKVRPIVGFEVVDLKRLESARPAEVPISARRHFLFLLDLSFSHHENLLRATEAARSLLDTALHPTDLVAIGVYGQRTQAGMLLNFTSDRSQVETVLDTLEQVFGRRERDTGSSDRAADPLGLVAGPYASIVNDIGRAAGVERTLSREWLEEGGDLHGIIAETLIEMDANITNRRREIRRSEVDALSRSLSALAQQTRGVDGRKYMVYFSEGFDSDLLFEEGGARTLRDLNEMIEEMQRAGWVLQTVNIARSGESLLDAADGLLMIARETGGDFYANFNRLDTAMEQMLDATGVTYLLTIRADEVRMDGSFHELRVRLEDAPRGARVRHRAGYFAPNPVAEKQGLSEQLRLAELVLAGEDGGALPAAVAVAAFEGGERSRVATWIEVDGSALLADFTGDRLDLEIYGYTIARGGEIDDFFSQSMSLDLTEHRDVLERGGLRFYGDFELPAGSYDLRFLVRRASDGRYGLRSAELEVETASSTGPRLLPPFFVDDTENAPWLTVAESSSEDADYPFVIGERRFVPAVEPVVAKDRPARLCVMGYRLDHPQLSLEARLTTADGFAVAVDALSVVGRNAGTGGRPTQLYLNLDAAKLAPGEYEVTISVSEPDTEAGDETAIGFRVVA